MRGLKYIVISSLVLCGGIALTSVKNDSTVYAEEIVGDKVIDFTPKNVHFASGLVLPGYQTDAGRGDYLNIYGEYFTASFNGKTYSDFFDLELKFYPVKDGFNKESDYPSLVLSSHEWVFCTKISEAINLFYDKEMPTDNYSVALRYVAKEGSGYTNSIDSYYLPYEDPDFSDEQKANTCHEFTPSFLDEPYLFGPASGASWEYNENYKLKKNGSVYSLELELKACTVQNDSFKMYVLPYGSGSESFGQRKEFAPIAVPEDGKYRFEFSYKSQPGFTSYSSNDNSINGFYRLTKINDVIEEPVEAGINVLAGHASLLNYKQLGNLDINTHTNGNDGDGNNIVLKGDVILFLYELDETKVLNSFKLFWEASCPLEYEIYTSNKITENSLVDEIRKEEAGSDYAAIYSSIDMNTYSDFVKVADVKRTSNEQGEGGMDFVEATKATEAKYVLIRTTKASNNGKAYGYRLFEIEAFEAVYNQSFVGAQLGSKTDNDQVVNAIRFIGKAKIDDITTYTDLVSFQLTYSDGTNTKTSKPIEINTYYKTLITTMDGVAGVSMTAADGYYFFSFTLGGVVDGSYTIDLNVTDSENNTLTIASASYNYSNGTLTRA